MAAQKNVAELIAEKSPGHHAPDAIQTAASAPEPTAQELEIQDLRARLKDAEARLKAHDADRPAHLAARAPGIYRVRLEGCRPRTATFTVARREHLPREVVGELSRYPKSVHPIIYPGNELAGEPAHAAWERYMAETGVPADARYCFRVQPESGPLQDYLDIPAGSKADAFEHFCALNHIPHTERKWTAELLPAATPAAKAA